MQKLIDGVWHTRDSIVEQYAGLVYQQANSLCHGDLHYMHDLRQFGFIGLLKGFERFDETSGAKFMTYAYKFVRGYMLNANRHRGLIHVPSPVKNAAWKIDKLDLWDEADEELSEHLKCTRQTVESARIFMDLRNVNSLDKQDGDYEDQYHLTPYEEDLTKIHADYYLKGLNSREVEIANLLILGYTQMEIAKNQNITQQRIGQIVKGIRKKVQRKLEQEELQWQ